MSEPRDLVARAMLPACAPQDAAEFEVLLTAVSLMASNLVAAKARRDDGAQAIPGTDCAMMDYQVLRHEATIRELGIRFGMVAVCLGFGGTDGKSET